MSRRLFAWLTVMTLLVPLVLTGQVTLAAAETPVPPSPSGLPRALQLTPLDALGTYIVRLDNPSLARYRGGIGGLAATNIEVTGVAKLDVAGPAAQAYLAYLAERRAELLQRAEERLGRRLEVRYVYDVILNGFSVELTPSEAALLATLPGVIRVEPREMRQLLTDRGPQWIGAAAAWGAAPDCAGGNCGEGIVVGIVDTGINMDHPSFADIGGDGYNHTNPRGQFYGWCNPAHPDYDPALTCNDKLIGVYSYPGSGNDPEDEEGHGSHTASTAAGNRLNSIVLDAPTVALTFDISGVAPHANIIAYDACDIDGCPTDVLIEALQQAATDQVDALNYSISGSGQSPWVASDEQAFLDLRSAGAFVSASAGNSGPGASTVAHGSPWVTTTAASTHDRALVNAVVNLTTDQGTQLAAIYGRSVTSALPVASIVYAGDYGNALCETGIWGGSVFAGQIVVCDRGVNARVEKAEVVQAAGGGGMILANAASNGDEEIGDAYAIPGVHITYDEGVALKAWLNNGDTGHRGAIQGTVQDTEANNGDVMAAFSSRGPNSQVPDLIKPDMTAPGVDILAAVASLGQTAPEIAFYSGTSMSSPHMTGAGALMMRAKSPAWSVAEIQSALMTTAVYDNTVRKEDGVTPTSPFDRGAGRVNIANALNAGLLLNITEAQYTAADPATGGDPKTLNYPSMADDACYKSCGWTRTVRNPTGQSMTWHGTFTGKDGLAGALTVPSFTIAAGGTQSFGVNIPDVTGLMPGQWYFGQVVYTEASGLAPDAHFPVAIRVAGSTDRTMIEKTATPTGAGTGAQITYAVTVKNTLASSRTFNVSDVVPAGTTFVSGSNTGGWTYNSGSNTLSGSVNLGAASFTWSEENRSGYQSMAAEGIPPADLGTTNRDTGCFLLGGMDFYYLGQHYTDVVVSMNGVMRAGIPISPLCPSNTPKNIPANEARDENENVIVPFWADLDLTGGNMYLVLTVLNGRLHTVIEWEDAVLKGRTEKFSFQLWIEDGTDNIWFAYEPGFNTLLGVTNPVATIGAENLAGTQATKYYYYSGSGSPTGNVPNGSVDVRVGLLATTATFGFKANVTAGANTTITNEATATVSGTSNTAWASTRICGPATAAQPGIAIQSLYYTLTEWPGSAFDSYELWRSTAPYVTPGTGGSVQVYSGKSSSHVDAVAPVVGDPGINYYYTLRTLNCAGNSTADSAGVAEFDYALIAGQ